MTIQNYVPNLIKSGDLGPKADLTEQRKTNEFYKFPFNESISIKDEHVFEHNVSYLYSKPKINKKNLKRHKSLKILKTRLNKITKFQKKIENRHKNKQNKLPKVSKRKAFQLAIEKTVNEDNTFLSKTIFVNSKEERDVWLNTRSLLEIYSPSINEHLLRRIEHFLLQLTSCCFGTGLIFKVAPTHHQAVSATKLRVNFKGKGKTVCKRNAAHGSTFPSLIAYHKESRKKKVTVLPYTYTYIRMNSTMALPICINQADIKIDGTKHDSDFSTLALKILNKAAQGKIMPVAAMAKFIQALTTEILEAKQKKFKDSDTKEAIKVFSSEMEILNKFFKKNLKTWVFNQLDMFIDKKTSKKKCDVMLKLRMEAMRRDVSGQAKIMNRIYILAHKVLARIQDVKTPPNYFVVFKKVLIKTMKGKDRIRLQKLFSLDSSAICKATSSKIEAHASKEELKKLNKKISDYMSQMRKKERNIRGKSMMILRVSKNMEQKELSKKLKSTKIDLKKINQFENNILPLNTQNAIKVARALKVPKVLLVNRSFFS